MMRYLGRAAAMDAIRKSLRPHSDIDRLERLHPVRAAPFVACARPIAPDVGIDAEPALVCNRLHHPVAGLVSEFTVAPIGDTWLENLRESLTLRIFVLAE